MTDVRNARTSVRVAFLTSTYVTTPPPITASASVTLARLGVAATATLIAPPISATADVTLARLTAAVSAALSAPDITATAAVTLARLTAAASSITSPGIDATVNVTLRPVKAGAIYIIAHDLVFVPPTVGDLAYKGEPFKHWLNEFRGVNVWLLEDGTFTIDQPANNEGVVKVYWGSHVNPISGEERDALFEAGFGEYIHGEWP